MHSAANEFDQAAIDKAILRRLGFAVLAMCAGAIGIVVLAFSVGQHV